jgi:hypothetical protein
MNTPPAGLPDPLNPPPTGDPLTDASRIRLAPVAAAPQSTALQTATTNRVVPPPASFTPVWTWVGRLLFLVNGSRDHELAARRDNIGGLQAMNRAAPRHVNEAEQAFAAIRAIEGVAYMLRGRNDAQYRTLHRAAADLRDRAERALSSPVPLERTHPSFYNAYRTAAHNVHEHLRDRNIPGQLRTFANDAGIPVPQRVQVLEFVRQAVAAACDQLALSPRHPQIADDLEEALIRPAQDTLLPLVCSLGSVALGTVGALPGPDSASISLIKVVLHWKIVAGAGSASRLGTMLERAVRWLTRAARFTPTEAASFEAVVQRASRFRSTDYLVRVDSDAAFSQAGRKLSDQFQQGPRLSAALAVLNLIQLGAAIKSLGDPDTPVGQAVTNVASTGLAASTGLVTAANRLDQAFLIGGRDVPVGRVRNLLRALGSMIEDHATAISTATAVLSIVGGVYTIVSATSGDEVDWWNVTVGGLQVASGIAIAAGVLLGVPGAQPVGVVLGLVAGVMSLGPTLRDAVRTPPERAMNKLIEGLKALRSTWDNARLVDSMQLRGLVDALERAHGGTTYGTIDTGLNVDAYQGYRRRLHSLGIPDADAREMITTDLLPAAVDRYTR